MYWLKTCFNLLTIGFFLVACVTTQAAPTSESVTAESILTQTATPVTVAQAATPTLAPTPQDPTNMVIWWPEPLSPLDNGDAADLLSQQISAFQVAQGNIEVKLRLKTEEGLGGIISTLRAASPVAPGALPDLTLMRRNDLQAAALAGLIYPLEGNVSSAILGDLYDSALELGQVNGQLYGLPYMLEAQHMAYHADEVPASSRFSDILASDISFALPVAQADQINGILLTQYLSAGGTLPEGEDILIDAEALLQTLEFYEDAANQGLIDAAVLNYTSPADYHTALVAGTLDAGVVSSTTYLNFLDAGEDLSFGPVPTQNGEIIGELNGWMWVMTTASTERQALATRFLNWMMNASRQGEYSRTINMIPSQRTALQVWQTTPYIEFIRQLLNNVLLPLSDNEGGTTARSVQNALVSVLSGENTAAGATDDLLARLSG